MSTFRKFLILTVVVGGLQALLFSAKVNAADVLILDSTVTGGMDSIEYQIITTALNTPVPGFSSVLGLGLTATLVSPATWATPPSSYGSYKAIVLGDPNCSIDPVLVTSAAANSSTWAGAVTGNVVVIGTDPTVHPGPNGTLGAQLWRSAIAFAVASYASDGTGAVISLSCYYYAASPATTVPVLAGFGTFLTETASCANSAAIVASSPALTGLTSATLSNWGCSAHEGFTSWPSTFMPLAIVTDSSVPHVFTNGSVSGFPYILARGKTLTSTSLEIDPCCPPWNSSLLKSMMFYQGSGPISDPYTLKFTPTIVFKNQMQAYINYLYSLNSAMSGITIDWRLHDQGSGSSPAPSYGPQIGSTQYVTWNMFTNGNPTISAPGFFNGFDMIVGNWYMVHTGIYLENGQTFFPESCAQNEIYVRVQVLNDITKRGTIKSGAFFQFMDVRTKKVIDTVPIGDNSQDFGNTQR